jgi:hypothetical protein
VTAPPARSTRTTAIVAAFESARSPNAAAPCAFTTRLDGNRTSVTVSTFTPNDSGTATTCTPIL